EAGARVLRTVLLGTRRYETFESAAAFRDWADHAWQALLLAEPIVARQDLRLAVENHKDLRTDEFLPLLKRLNSRHVGVCVDLANSIALLEDPLEVIEAYAPWAFSTHIKDVAVSEYEEGFLLGEVPLGEGILDLKKIAAILRQARPEVHFNLEMITRDPLKVPCLTPKFWATFESLPGRHLAPFLSCLREADSNGLLWILNLLFGLAALQLSMLVFVHCAFDCFLRLLTILSGHLVLHGLLSLGAGRSGRALKAGPAWKAP